jgi:hypothetical protein
MSVATIRINYSNKSHTGSSFFGRYCLSKLILKYHFLKAHLKDFKNLSPGAGNVTEQ